MSLTNPAKVLGHGIAGGDLSVKNYGNSTLSAGTTVKFDTSNPGSGTYGGPPGVVITADDKCHGILVEDIAAGKVGRMRFLGSAVSTAGATLHSGDPLMANSSGAVVVCTSGKYQVGTCINECLSGDPALVLVNPTANISA